MVVKCCAACDACGHIQYENPKIVVGCLPTWGERILICKRAIEPRYGLWTLPAGFMENNESATEGAAREALEEANARVEIEDLYTLYSLPHISQVYMFYRCELIEGEHAAGPESLETALFTEAEVPWERIAFPVVYETLREYFTDVTAGEFPVRVSAIERGGRR